jgi:ribose transport system substrate-binding protein
MDRPMISRRRALAGLLPLVAAGCRRGRKRVIGVVPKSTSDLFWVAVENGARAAGKRLGADIEWNGALTESDFPRQIQIVESMIARHVDAIALAAAERKALVQVLDRAAAAGIPVAIFDSGLDSENYVSFIATDNYEAGQMAARKLAGLLGDKGNVAMLLHAPGSFSTLDRERGFEDVITREFPLIRIVARQYGLSSRAKSVASAENILTAHPDLDGFFSSSEPSASGVSLALAARGLAGKVKSVAFDSSDAMLADMRRGVVSATVIQDPYGMGYASVSTLVDKLNGKVPPKRQDLHAQVITAADLNRAEILRLLNPKPE